MENQSRKKQTKGHKQVIEKQNKTKQPIYLIYYMLHQWQVEESAATDRKPYQCQKLLIGLPKNIVRKAPTKKSKSCVRK